MSQLKRCWSALPSSFWFVPTLIVAGSITLAMALVEAHSTGSAQWLMVSLGYLDAYRSAWLPANLIQAQRDYFGAHTYERIDAKGTFHTEWEKE